MNITENEFRLVEIKTKADKILFIIKLVADEEIKRVYLNNYFEGLYLGKASAKFNVFTEVNDDCIVGEMMYDTLRGISLQKPENLQRLWVSCRIGNTYIDQPVYIRMKDKSISFRHAESFGFIPKNDLEFYFAYCKNKVEMKNPLENLKDVKDIKNVRVEMSDESITIKANISKRLLDYFEEQGIQKELCLVWKSLNDNEIYYFHGEEIHDDCIEYRLLIEETEQLGKLQTDGKIFEWIMADAADNQYRLYIDENEEIEEWELPIYDYYAKIIRANNNCIQMYMITTILYSYFNLCYDGNGIELFFKKRTYDLELQSVIAQKVNTDIEYSLPIEVMKEDEKEIYYKIRLKFDVDESDFKIGIYQFWNEVKDGMFVQRYPLKLLRKNLIRENTYLISKHPYSVIGDYYYNCLFYNDTSNNLKCNVVPKRIKLQITDMRKNDESVNLSFRMNKEPYFESVSDIQLTAENGDINQIGFKIYGDSKKANDIEGSFSVPFSLLCEGTLNDVYRPEIRFSDRAGRMMIENNYFRPAVNDREVRSFSFLKRLEDNSFRRIWGNHVKGAYVLGVTENAELLKLIGMWLYEDDKLCIRIEWLDENYAEQYDDKKINLYLRDKLTGEVLTLDREYAVKNEIIFRIPLCELSNKEYLIYGMMPNGVISYIENMSATYTLFSNKTSKKVTLKRVDTFLNISVEEMLIFENSEKIAESQAIIQKAREENEGKCRKIWLIGENYGLSARDNGLAFFEYCMKHKDSVDAEVYFVSKVDNEDIDALEIYRDHVIIYDSPKHIYMDELTEFYIVSHGIRDVMPSLYHNKIGKYRKNIIYLQHGITAIKKLGISNSSYGGSIRRFIVSSEQEKELMVKNKQFWEEEISVSGMARYDKLLSSNNNFSNYIWIMPTWRDWLVKSEKDFVNSDFYHYYCQILGDPRLIKALKESNQKLVFNLHIEFEKYKSFFDKFENDVVHITDMHEKSITERIEQCSMIVSDYSSIIFDVVYLGKPVIFFQFDQDMYNKHRGSYVDLETDLPGKVTHKPDVLINALLQKIQDKFAFDREYLECAKHYFDYRDCNNSERIYNAVIECRKEIADEY